MEKYIEDKPPILKDTSFWKTVYDYWHFVETTAFFFISLAPEYENRILWMSVYFPVTLISEIILAIVSNSSLKTMSLRRVILRRIIPLLFFFVICFSTLSLQRTGSNFFAFLFALSIAIVILTSLQLIFQKRIDNSKGIINYLFGNIVRPDIDLNEKDHRNKVISRIFFFALLCGYIIWYIIAHIIL